MKNPDWPTSEYVLYGVECSYYAAKTRAQLQYKRLPFHEIQASRRVYADVIGPRVGWPVVPVLVTPADETVQDTSDIFDLLEARHPAPACLPDDACGRILSYLLEFLGDEWLKLPAMHYRWNHNYAFIVAEFGRNNDPELAVERQRAIGERIAPRFHTWLPPLGIVPASHACIEAEYLAFLDLFDRHLRDMPYLLGNAPSLGDFAFFGPLYAHLWRDPASGVTMEARAPAVVAWIERLRAGAPTVSAPLGTATIIDSLRRLLTHLLRDFVPITRAATAIARQWLADHPGDGEVPRHCGEHAVTLGRGTAHAVDVTRAVFTYDLYMLQRLIDAWRACPADERAVVAALFDEIGASGLLDMPLAHRVTRRDYRMVRA